MSVQHEVYVKCDKCNALTDSMNGKSARGARARAKLDGWKLGKSKDFCPSCAVEIAKAVAEAQAGNIG